LVRYIEGGRVKPLLAGTYPLSEIKRAQEDFQKKSFFGKLVVVPR
jgi:NADPH:quinone reductase-like Zn-dependent oxidoreductase